VHTSQVKAVVPGLIEQAIAAALAPIRAEMSKQQDLIDCHRLALAALIVRVEACEQDRGDSATVTALKADVSD